MTGNFVKSVNQCNFVYISGLLDLANAYCEEALKRHCERIIRHGITTENAAMLYAVAIKYEATVSTIMNFCTSLKLDNGASYISCWLRY